MPIICRLLLCAVLACLPRAVAAQNRETLWTATLHAPDGVLAGLWRHFLTPALAADSALPPGSPIAVLQNGGDPAGASTALALMRRNATARDQPLLTSTDTVNHVAQGGFYWNTNITHNVVNARDGAGNFLDGPRAISLGLQSSVISSAALNSAFAGDPGKGSQHIALWATALRKPDTAPASAATFTPTKARPYAQLWAQIWNLVDTTNLPSSLGGALLNEDDIEVNNLDDANSRQAFSINLWNQSPPSASVIPAEVYAGISLYSFGNDRPSSGTFKSFISLGGNYSVSALDLRRIRPISTTVAAALVAPATTLPVASVLPFTSTGDAYQPPSETNPLPVLIGGHAYTCIGFALGGTGMAAGTITLRTPVSVADGALNSVVANANLHAIWLGNGASIAWTDGGGVEAFYDAPAKALHFRGADALFDDAIVALGGYRVGPDQVVGARIDGWGTSSNGRRGGLDGRTATPAQTAAALAQLLIDLKTHGLIGN